MKTKNTYDLALALYKVGCTPTKYHVKKYVRIEDENGFKWFKFNDTKLQKKIGRLMHEKQNNIPVAVSNVYKVEHIVGILKQMCIESKEQDVVTLHEGERVL